MKRITRIALSGTAILSITTAVLIISSPGRADNKQTTTVNASPDPANTVTLSAAQAQSLKVQTIDLRDFNGEYDATGYIDFNQDRIVPVSSPWAGRIREVRVKAGDSVKKGQILFTLSSPDLVQAEANLISTAGVLELTRQGLERARNLAQIQGYTQKDLEQAISDHQTAQGNHQAARNAVLIFGKSDAEIDHIIASRKTEGELRVTSPVTGQVTARNAAPGLLVQPDNAAAPVTVADTSGKWMVASVPEDLVPMLHLGQQVSAAVNAYPGRSFNGKISYIGSAIDPNTHTVSVRSEISDPKHELLPQMLAVFTLSTGSPVRSVAIPQNGIVREGDGTVTVFVTRDGLYFTRRVVQVGIAQNGMQQILSGLTAGERVATDGALFLSNALALSQR